MSSIYKTTSSFLFLLCFFLFFYFIHIYIYLYSFNVLLKHIYLSFIPSYLAWSCSGWETSIPSPANWFHFSPNMFSKLSIAFVAALAVAIEGSILNPAPYPQKGDWYSSIAPSGSGGCCPCSVPNPWGTAPGVRFDSHLAGCVVTYKDWHKR